MGIIGICFFLFKNIINLNNMFDFFWFFGKIVSLNKIKNFEGI